MKKTLLVLGVFLLLAIPAKANHEAELAHELCGIIAQAREIPVGVDYILDAMRILCSYNAWLEVELAKRPNGARVSYRMAARQAPIPATKTMMVFRHYPHPKVSSLEAMTPLGLEVRQEAGLLPANGEVLNCTHRTEPFTLAGFGGEATVVQANRIRLICGQSEFVVIGIVF